MALSLRSTSLVPRAASLWQVSRASSTSVVSQLEQKFFPHIGNREIVGFGRNGLPQYLDDVTHPYPSIRFKEMTPEIRALHEKEKGDWKNLSLEEKKALYRYSFRQTFAEVEAPDITWKIHTSWALSVLAIGCFILLYVKKFVTRPKVNKLATDEYRKALMYRDVYQYRGAITGLSSKFDYENKRWKDK